MLSKLIDNVCDFNMNPSQSYGKKTHRIADSAMLLHDFNKNNSSDIYMLLPTEVSKKGVFTFTTDTDNETIHK